MFAREEFKRSQTARQAGKAVRHDKISAVLALKVDGNGRPTVAPVLPAPVAAAPDTAEQTRTEKAARLLALTAELNAPTVSDPNA